MDLTRKTTFFEGWSWFKFNNLGLALGIALKFYTSVKKGLKLKVTIFLWLFPTFVEITWEKLKGGGGPFYHRRRVKGEGSATLLKRDSNKGVFKNNYFEEHWNDYF